ncbi:hypothetical protein BUALT_Bualt19G0101100 [Buddleja alternifolia]|uniref:Uncharacterized protein n=1 Tax=Buddleja alternifolia TaxID=168488 RepID=A0AAV6W945_9LAMI|nr:hypothetical protein BUALT_Bualt19G0101100 [Buddleja alternifolia]
MSYYNQNQPPVGVPPPQGKFYCVTRRKDIRRMRIRRKVIRRKDTLRRGIRRSTRLNTLNRRRSSNSSPIAPVSWKDVWLHYVAVASLMHASDELWTEIDLLSRQQKGKKIDAF